MTDPNQGAWNYTYDALGQLKTQTDAKGQVTTLAYDEFGRLTAKTNPTQNGFWYHDKTAAGAWCAAGLARACETRAGQPAPSNAVIVSESITYDALNRPQQSTTCARRSHLHQQRGLRHAPPVACTRQTYPTGFAVGYTYSAGRQRPHARRAGARVQPSRRLATASGASRGSTPQPSSMRAAT